MCEFCGNGPECCVCGRGNKKLTALPFKGLRWEVFEPRSARVVARCRSRTMARVLAWLYGYDYAPAGWGHV